MKTLLPTIRRLARLPGAAVPDSELLCRFVRGKDPAAFELLVHRHGPMILGLCRKLIRDGHEAEDAFQATFLTLACRARTIRKSQSLGSWLYQVAYRMCLRMRRKARQFHAVAVSGYAPAAGDSPCRLAQRHEEAQILAAEINRLSECLRSVVVMCHLQGKSPFEAARELGCPPNTVSIRLRRARERLKARLGRRGLGLSMSIASSLGATTASADVAPALASSLAGTAAQVAAGASAAALVGQPISSLVKGALIAMWWKPLKVGSLALLALCAVTVPICHLSSSAQAQAPQSVRTEPLPFYNSALARFPETVQEHWLMTAPTFQQGIYRWNDGRYAALSVPEPTYAPDENLPDEVKKLIADQQKKEEAIRKAAEAQMREQRLELFTKLRQMQETYTKAGDLDRAVAIRDQARRLEIAIAEARPAPQSLGDYRNQAGKSFIFFVVARKTGALWGDGIYTDDSDVATAAVHAGLLRPGQRGLVKVTILEGRPTYGGSVKNGVTSQSYGAFPGSYRIERAPDPGAGIGTDKREADEAAVSPLESMPDRARSAATSVQRNDPLSRSKPAYGSVPSQGEKNPASPFRTTPAKPVGSDPLERNQTPPEKPSSHSQLPR